MLALESIKIRNTSYFSFKSPLPDIHGIKDMFSSFFLSPPMHPEVVVNLKRLI